MAEAASLQILDGLRDFLVTQLQQIGRSDLASRFTTSLDRGSRLTQAISALQTLESECWSEYAERWGPYWQVVQDDMWQGLRQRWPNLDDHIRTILSDPDDQVRRTLKTLLRAMGMALLRYRQAVS